VGLPVRGQLTTIRPLTDGDVDMLVRWHADPEVSRYWDDETYTREELVEELQDPLVEEFIVEADGEPVGFVQAWREEDEPLRGGIDMFLIPSGRGRGLGPDAGRALARHLQEERGWAYVTVDPYAWNERAIAGWRKAGFELVDGVEREPDEDHADPWLLMKWRG
jgi:aminoglycoside 6'-N-acetyltransferase